MISFPNGERRKESFRLSPHEARAFDPLPYEREILPPAMLKARQQCEHRDALVKQISTALALRLTELIQARDPVNGYPQAE